MRYGTAEQLHRAGFGPKALTELQTQGRTRASGEAASPDNAQQVVDGFLDRPWFQLSWVRPALPEVPGSDDMDFGTAATIRQVHCLFLALYCEDEWLQ
jgi:hypothetical protein